MTSFSDRCFHCGSRLTHRLSDGLFVCPLCGATYRADPIAPIHMPPCDGIMALFEVNPPAAVVLLSEIRFPETMACLLTKNGLYSFATKQAKNRIFDMIEPEYMIRPDDNNPKNTIVRAELRVVPKGYVFR